MRSFVLTAIIGATSMALAPAHADGRHHRHRADAAAAYYGWDAAPGQIVRDATARAEREPGLTNEIDSSAHQTATGGPSGGLPNSGGL